MEILGLKEYKKFCKENNLKESHATSLKLFCDKHIKNLVIKGK